MVETPSGAGNRATESFDAIKELMQEQQERQGRIRHVQQFLKSPAFVDLRDRPVVVSDSPEDIEARKRDLDYRIRVVESLMTLLLEEREFLDRTRSADTNEQSGSADKV